ncbi:MAG: nucleoside triphosphate pyrophosphohydrolase [Clostridia bacterium]|nr:nucleoside triphosphate pyrophosphohydrolase [Clostridia bacterium]MBQ5716966.1 nucleoside triphosphate pyrophosphohydrolase [Clostridia bacterium]
MIDFKQKENYDIYDLIKIMEHLRSEDGCPWDREQSHESIRSNVIEEAYEVADAIDSGSQEMLVEELGDLLLQVVFHARMDEEAGGFNFNDVCDGICKKLVYRHPHVFGDVNADTSDEVLKNWDALKKTEKKQESFTDTLNSVPKAFPALMRSQKVQKRAARAGFDFDNKSDVYDKVAEEMVELSDADALADNKKVFEEYGDLLFSVVNLARFLNIDAEEALAASTDKFIARFEKVEKLANERNIDMPNTPITELDKLWDEVKGK